MRTLKPSGYALTALAILSATPADAAGMSWQDAVARLAQERAQVEVCVSVIKSRGDDPARVQAAAIYGKAKAEVDGVVAGLVVALAKDRPPSSLSDLIPRLDRATAGRDALCGTARTLLPPDPGAKGGVADIIGAVLGPVAEAVKDLVLAAWERDALARRTIQTQVEATAWPAYSDIQPAAF